jgi:hypothetical protein
MLASLLSMTGSLGPILDFAGRVQATGGRFGAIEGGGLTPVSGSGIKAPRRRAGAGWDGGRDHYIACDARYRP